MLVAPLYMQSVRCCVKYRLSLRCSVVLERNHVDFLCITNCTCGIRAYQLLSKQVPVPVICNEDIPVHQEKTLWRALETLVSIDFARF
jgi:hypothetical protein